MADSGLEKVANDSQLTVLKFNGEEMGMDEVLEKCKPILDTYYASLQPKPRTNREKRLALQIELGSSWTPDPEIQKEILELLFLEKRGNVYFPNKQDYS